MFSEQSGPAPDFETYLAKLKAMTPDRELTDAEIARRDLLMRLVLDADASDIPLPPDERRHNYWLDFATQRRLLAARYLGMWIAHDSIVAPLAEFVRATPPLVDATPPQVAGSREKAEQFALRDSTRDARFAATQALATSASKEAIPELVGLLGDAQLSGSAHHYLNGLLRARVQATMAPDEIEQYRSAPLFGWSADASANAQADSAARLLAWWNRQCDGLRLPRAFVFEH